MVSEANLVSKEEFDGGTDPMPTAAEVMHKDVIAIRDTEKIPAAARKLVAAGVRRLFVVNDAGQLVGVLSRRDLLVVYLRSDERLAEEISEDVLAASLWIDGEAVQVAVADGIVTLTGTLPRRSEVDIVVRLVQARPGVVGVVDNLRYG